MNFGLLCCNSCALGSVINNFDNVTKVRPAGDSGGTHYTATPFPRSFICESDPVPGSCLGWVAGGDRALSSQLVQDAIDDIMGCGAADLNCYSQNGTTDMRLNKLFGGQWIFARKFWHGQLGFASMDRGNNPTFPADQVH